MKIEFNFDINDWEAFQKYHFANSPTFRRRKRIMLFFYLFILTFACTMSLKGVALFIVLPTVIVLWVAFMRFGYNQLLIRKAKNKLQKNENMHDVFGRMELTFNIDGFWLTTPASNNFVTWHELEYVDEDTDYFYLHKTEQDVCIIPKRKIAGKLDELNKVFEENIVIHEN